MLSITQLANNVLPKGPFIIVCLVAQMVKNLPAVQETCILSLSWEDLLEKRTPTHSSILSWKIPVDTGAW